MAGILAGAQAGATIISALKPGPGQTGQALQPGLEASEEYGIFGPAASAAQAAQAQAVFAPATAALTDTGDSDLSALTQAAVSVTNDTPLSSTSSSLWIALAVAVGAGLILYFLTGRKG